MTTRFRPPTRPSLERYRTRIERLREAGLNFELDQDATYDEGEGWRHDRYEAELPSEPPGPPLDRGAWALACEVVRQYDFPDPDLITGIYVPDEPLPGRPMLLRARFLGLSFWFGVRIGKVIDEVRGEGDEEASVWGYSYSTLEGHFEQGQITFEVWKYHVSGRVVFRIRAFSRTGTIRNPFYRIGFKLFGRRLQIRFAEQALDRVQLFVQEGLAAQEAAVPPKSHSALDVEEAEPDTEASERLDELSS